MLKGATRIPQRDNNNCNHGRIRPRARTRLSSRYVWNRGCLVRRVMIARSNRPLCIGSFPTEPHHSFSTSSPRRLSSLIAAKIHALFFMARTVSLISANDLRADANRPIKPHRRGNNDQDFLVQLSPLIPLLFFSFTTTRDFEVTPSVNLREATIFFPG